MPAVLLAWIGQTDLDCAAGKRQGRGPIASVVAARAFDALVLLSNYPAARNRALTDRLVETDAPPVHLRPEPLDDPTDYGAIYGAAVRALEFARGLELVKKLATQGRLVPCPLALPDPPLDDRGWCAEALATHDRRPFTGGVIVTESVKGCYRHAQAVARIDRLSSAPWWAARSPSVRLTRTLAEYETHLDPILRCSNSVMFIDPHLDPEKPRYGGFGTLLQRAGWRTPAPRIEIHRVCYEGAGRDRRFPDFAPIFRGALDESLRVAGLTATVYIWDDFHDRYLISNVIGMSLPNGFDVSSAPGTATTWTRLGRRDRDDIQREFDPAARRHALRDRFEIP